MFGFLILTEWEINTSHNLTRYSLGCSAKRSCSKLFYSLLSRQTQVRNQDDTTPIEMTTCLKLLCAISPWPIWTRSTTKSHTVLQTPSTSEMSHTLHDYYWSDLVTTPDPTSSNPSSTPDTYSSHSAPPTTYTSPPRPPHPSSQAATAPPSPYHTAAQVETASRTYTATMPPHETRASDYYCFRWWQCRGLFRWSS